MLTYTIVRLSPSDTVRVREFLVKTFFKDEPLNIAIGLVQDGQRCLELEEYCTMPLSQGVSLGAINEKNELVGVSINNINYRRESISGPADSGDEDCTHPKFKLILAFLKWLDKKVDVFSKFENINKYLDISILSTDPAYRGQGIAKKLIYESIDSALDNDIPLIKVDCTSRFSAKAVTRLGFSSIFNVAYDEYTGPDNKPVFSPPPPHDGASCCILDVKRFQQERGNIINA
uniref:aralkylamine N-acetyltransferase n=1 Tax=Cacopsylla melanoneura TaxID=428564 RepID=A0A8D8QPL8_9HEMI